MAAGITSYVWRIGDLSHMTDIQEGWYREGEVVQLRSGGPEMTVTYAGPGAFGSGEIVRCMWFAGTKQMSGEFLPDSLKRVKSGLASKSFCERIRDS